MDTIEHFKKLIVEVKKTGKEIDLDRICTEGLTPNHGLSLIYAACSCDIMSEVKGRQGTWEINTGLSEGWLSAGFARLCWKLNKISLGIRYGWEAFRLLEDNLEEGEKVVEFCEELGEMSGIGGGGEDADYKGVVDLADRLGNKLACGRFMILSIMWDINSNKRDAAREYFPRLKKIVNDSNDTDLKGSMAILESLVMIISGHHMEGIIHYESYLSPFSQMFLNPLFPRISGLFILAYADTGQVNVASGIIQEIRLLAEKQKDPSLTILADYSQACLYIGTGKRKDAKQILTQLVEDLKKRENNLFARFTFMELAGLAAEDGDVDSCRTFFNQSVDIAKKTCGVLRYFSVSYLQALLCLEDCPETQKKDVPAFTQVVKEFIEFDNDYMAGYAYLLEATRDRKMKKGRPDIGVLLNKAESALKKSGSRLGLGRLFVERAYSAIENNNEKEVILYVQHAAEYFNHVKEQLIPDELKPYFREKEKKREQDIAFRKFKELITSIAKMELVPLLSKGLKIFCELIYANWAGIWLPDDTGAFDLKAGCNITRQSITTHRFKKVLDVIDQISHMGDSIEDNFFSKGSKDRMLPLYFQEKIIGVLCFGDYSEEYSAGSATEDMAKAFVSLFAIEISHASQYEEIKRLTRQLKQENTYYKHMDFSRGNFDEIIGNSPGIITALSLISQVGPTDSTVLIQGETGSGKELFARAIHNASSNKEGPFIHLNCGAFPSELIESELFGHEKGAFTGAVVKKLGYVELADKGTLFLDEVGELSLSAQVKLLKVIQEKEFSRVGGTTALHSNFRLIIATHRDLQEMVKNNLFREDLFFRLAVFPVTVPPLRDRKEDIPLLALTFLEKETRKLNKEDMFISEKEMQKLKKEYHWPGNVRELMHIIERGAILTEGLEFIVPPLTYASIQSTRRDSPFQTLEEVERNHILSIIKETDNRISGPGGAAEILGINRNTLYGRMRKLGISRV